MTIMIESKIAAVKNLQIFDFTELRYLDCLDISLQVYEKYLLFMKNCFILNSNELI